MLITRQVLQRVTGANMDGKWIYAYRYNLLKLNSWVRQESNLPEYLPTFVWMEIACLSTPPHVGPFWAFQHLENWTLKKICRSSHLNPETPFQASTDGKLREIWLKMSVREFWLLPLNRVWQKLILTLALVVLKHTIHRPTQGKRVTWLSLPTLSFALLLI